MGRFADKGQLKTGDASVADDRNAQGRLSDHHLRDGKGLSLDPRGKSRGSRSAKFLIDSGTDQEAGPGSLACGLHLLNEC
jgi:hypothetical protein